MDSAAVGEDVSTSGLPDDCTAQRKTGDRQFAMGDQAIVSCKACWAALGLALTIIGILLYLSAQFLGELSVRMRLPAVLGELMAGLVLGLSGLHVIVLGGDAAGGFCPLSCGFNRQAIKFCQSTSLAIVPCNIPLQRFYLHFNV